MTERGLSDLVYEGVLRAMESFSVGKTDLEIAGAALCTDDELGTLYCMIVAADEVEESEDPDLLFSPVDWPCGSELEPFAEANKEMRQRLADAADISGHVEQVFAELVGALARIRAAKKISESAFLSVLSTDPSDYLLELEGRSVERLNSKVVVAKREEFLRRWA